MKELLITISNPHSDKEALTDAIQALESVDEDSQFWADIANSDQYNQDHRRQAVFALFQRHIHPPITLRELAKILDNPTWIKYENIAIVDVLAGEAPVTYNLDDTVFVLPVFPGLSDHQYAYWAVYLRVEGEVTVKEFSDILQDNNSDKSVLNRRLLEYGLSP